MTQALTPVKQPQVILGLTYTIIYELYWSPLARFPRPRLWAISRVPCQWSVFRGYSHIDVTALHELYGPVVRIGRHWDTILLHG